MSAAQIVLAAFGILLLVGLSPWLNHVEGQRAAGLGRTVVNIVGAALLIGAML